MMPLPDARQFEETANRRLARTSLLMLMSFFWSIIFILFLVILGNKLDNLGGDVAISGRVAGEDGHSIVNATVNITSHGSTLTTVTDDSGRFLVKDVRTGDTMVSINASGRRTQSYRTTTYNVFNEPGRTYNLDFILENGTGVKRTGGYSSIGLGRYCAGITVFFSVTTATQGFGILALKGGKNRQARIASMIGMLSFGFGISTFLSGLAFILIMKSENDVRIARKLADRERERK